MKRDIFGGEVSQQSKTEFFSATDMVRAGNKWRVANDLGLFNLSQWLQSASTLEFIHELEKKYGNVVIKGRGRNAHTWVHPLLFIDMALAISPSLKIEVYEWLFDHLLKHRNDSGDSYKEMCGALYVLYGNKREFPEFISKVADRIKGVIGVKDWQSADEYQLELRDRIHRSIKLLCNVLKNPVQAVRIGIYENTK